MLEEVSFSVIHGHTQTPPKVLEQVGLFDFDFTCLRDLKTNMRLEIGVSSLNLPVFHVGCGIEGN